MSNNNPVLNIGDWVRGKSSEGELIIGYIESLDTIRGVVKVTVVKCDNKDTITKTISILSKHVKKLPDSKAINKEQIRFLIDLAILTGDEEWFMALSSKLNSMKQLVDGML
ncbi:group-specific protein [Heyndrickxia shackletonii]|uniref:Group-specific protein n=1 Tax=Heyndrickxia shackletonii TaxID=157838 RepID=A0A0Q3X0F1_9BACI|nr:IDEAL domain-containing protein [Heyndrickxia shackletonii]KQL55535.1 group-specific protein [Heyndrickxia shackletonii]NEY99421.1 IDEAL domain-containing protein [Heyndrickxia shackletonii]